MKPLILCLFILVCTSCNRYFKSVNTSVPTASILENYVRDGRTFTLHDKSYAFEMTNVSVVNDSLVGNVIRLNGTEDSKGNGRYYHYRNVIPEGTVLKKVHLYTDENLTGKQVERRIAISSFTKMHDLQFDQGKTTRSHVGTAVGVFAGVVVLAAIVGSMLTFSFGLAP